MPVPITALYAGLLALVGLVLGASSGWLRAKTGVSLGGGDNLSSSWPFVATEISPNGFPSHSS